MKIFIISCGKAKEKKKTMAYLLFNGGFFKKQLALVKSMGAKKDNTFILSAKYGLVKCEKIIEPYELKMGNKGCVTLEFVRNQVKEFGLEGAEIVSTAGSAYRVILKEIFDKHSFPLEGVGGMGMQIKEMKRLIGRVGKD